MTPTAATQLAEAVVDDGFVTHRAALAALFAGARRRGICETLIGIAADPSAPTVVRERALGKLVVRYAAAGAESADRPAAAPVVCGTAA